MMNSITDEQVRVALSGWYAGQTMAAGVELYQLHDMQNMRAALTAFLSSVGGTEALAARVAGGGLDYTPGRIDKESPGRIWLQINTDGDNAERDDSWPGADDVTWQDESIGGLEVQYIRADLAHPATARAGVDAAVLAELERATTKFPTWPTDSLHALAVLGEEFGELGKAVLQSVYEPHKVKPGEVRAEAIQTAAMALRFLMSLDAYVYAPGEQHQQGGSNG